MPDGLAAPRFDPARLDDLASGDPAFAAELVAMLASESARLVALMDRAAATGDRDGVRGAAHALKGASSTLGFMALAEAARLLEAAAREGRSLESGIVAVHERLGDLELATP